MTEDEMEKLVKRHLRTVARYEWRCPKCALAGDPATTRTAALEDLKYHINEDHKGED